MNVFFLNSLLWPLAALAAIPLLLHLFARTRPPPYRFSSIEFILRAIRRTHRVKKPQDWILLALRTLIFSAIILMFLQPLFFSKRRLSSPFERKNVVAVVDATASMGYTEGAQTRFASACAQASGIVSGLSAGDTANVVWLRARPVSVFPELGVNFGHLQSELKRARVSSESGDPGGSLGMAMQLLEKAEGRREIFVISDFQKSEWEKVEWAAVPGVDLVKVKIGREPGANAAITDVDVEPPKVLANEEAAIRCDVWNFSPQPCRRTVFAAMQETRESQDLMIPAWQKATAVFRHRFTGAGTFPVSVTLNEDSFSGDDRRWALVEVRDALRVGIAGSDSETAGVWKRAMDAMGWAGTEMIPAGDTAGSTPFDVIMLAGDDGTALARLLGTPARDVTVVWAPALAGTKWAAPNGSNAPPVAVAWERFDKPRQVKIAAPGADIFRLFAGGDYGDPSRGEFSGRFAVPRAAFAGGEVLLAYDDGVPALVRFRRGGTLFYWNLAVRREFSDYASRVGFLPLLGEMILAGRTRTGNRPAGGDLVPGERLFWRLDGEGMGADVSLKGPDGKTLEVHEHRTPRDISLTSDEIAEPGLYSWEHQGQRLGYGVVNFPVVESDLRAMSVAELDTRTSTGIGEGLAIHWLREGIKLWPWLLGVAMLLALTEGAALVWVERS